MLATGNCKVTRPDGSQLQGRWLLLFPDDITEDQAGHRIKRLLAAVAEAI